MKYKPSLRSGQRKISIPAFVILGFAFGLLFPLFGSISEIILRGEGLSLDRIVAHWQTIPRAMRIGGPFILAILLGFIARTLRRRQQEQARHQADLLSYSKALEVRNESLANLNRALDGLVYTASHDLKTPVINFEGMIAMLKQVMADDPQSPLVANILARMDVAVLQFKETIEGLTEISQLENKLDQQAQPISVQEALESALDALEKGDRPRPEQLEIEIPSHLQVLLPMGFLERIFQNLLSNAVKFARKDPPLHLLIRARNQDQHVLIEFADNGIGIDLSGNEDKLFRMFTRLNKSEKGKGIGLYVVKRLVDGSGGKIEVESQLKQGTTFRLYFPSTNSRLASRAVNSRK